MFDVQQLENVYRLNKKCFNAKKIYVQVMYCLSAQNGELARRFRIQVKFVSFTVV